MARTRKRFAPEEKVAALRRHLVEKTPVSDLCDELEIRPAIFYNWQKRLFENGTAALLGGGKAPARSQEARRIAQLEAALALKNEVLVELVQEYVQVKARLGQPGGASFPSPGQRRGTRNSLPGTH